MKKILLVITIVFLTSCASKTEDLRQNTAPVGVGPGYNDYKLSPCACEPVPMKLKSKVEWIRTIS